MPEGVNAKEEEIGADAFDRIVKAADVVRAPLIDSCDYEDDQAQRRGERRLRDSRPSPLPHYESPPKRRQENFQDTKKPQDS